MNLAQFTESELLLPRLLSYRQDAAIQELAKRLEARDRIENAPAFVQAVLSRERELPTIIDSVAVPHGRGGAVRKLSVAIGLCAAGIPWGMDKGHLAKAVFLFAVPLAEAQAYLSLLAGLSSLIQDAMAFAALRGAARPEDMLAVLSQIRLVHTKHFPAYAPAVGGR